MGLFSNSSKKTTTNTANYQYAQDVNLSGGDSELGDGAIVAQHSNLSLIDNSLSSSMSDYSMRDSSTRTANSNNTDSSDNSFTNTQSDYSDRSSRVTTSTTDSSNRSFNDSSTSDYSVKNTMTDNSNRSTNINSVDGGAFSMVSGVMQSVVNAFSSSNAKMLEVVGLNQKETLGSSAALAGRSLDAAFAIKSGVEVAPPEGVTKTKMFDAGVKAVAALTLGFVAYKVFKQK